jgi:alcohol dehydrogenase
VQCRAGFKVFGEGSDLPGAHAEYVRVPSADLSLHLWGGLSPEMALLMTDALPSGMLGVRCADVAGDGTLLIVGGGPVGLCALACAKATGVGRVLVVEPNPFRREASKALGAEVLTPGSDLVSRVLDLTRGQGAHGVIEAVGDQEAVSSALECAGPHCRVVLLGMALARMLLPVRTICGNSLTVLGRVSAASAQWPHLEPLLQAGALHLDQVFTKWCTLDGVVALNHALSSPKTVKIAIAVRMNV